MTDVGDRKKAVDDLLVKIRAAYPDTAFSGSVTRVDGLPDEKLGEEELDEEKALYHGLRGKRWTDVDGSFVASNVDGISLLTDDAFTAFLPAWLIAALGNNNVRELLVYHFSPNLPDDQMSESTAHQLSERQDRRIRQLTSAQIEALLAFLTYCFEVETSEFIKRHARKAVDYVTHFRR